MTVYARPGSPDAVMSFQPRYENGSVASGSPR